MSAKAVREAEPKGLKTPRRRTTATAIGVRLVLAWLVIASATDAHAQAQGRASLQDGDRPTVLGVLGGSLLGGLGAAGVGGIALLAAGGGTDCYEGGCAALLLAAATWPLGTAIGARWAVRRQGFDVGLGRMILYSVLATGVGVGGALLVEQLEPKGNCAQPVPTGSCGTGPSDWAYGFAFVGADLATLVLLTHFTVEYREADASVSLAPLVTPGALGLMGAVRVP